MCAMCLSFGVASALLRRERTGRGGIVDVSLMHAAMVLANNQLIRSEEEDRPVHEAALRRLAAQRAEGVTFAEQAEAMPSSRFARHALLIARRSIRPTTATMMIAARAAWGT